MNCSKCDAAITESNGKCSKCGNLEVTKAISPDQIDFKTSAAIAWAMIVVGVLGLGFVIANSATDWYSGLDYVAPAFILVVGVLSLFWAVKRK